MISYDIAIVGATGLVGETFLTILAERDFPVNKIFALASARSVGEFVTFKNKQILVEDVATFDFSKAQFAFFSAGADVSLQYSPIAAQAGCTVIDNSSAFRYEKTIPLIVPEVNVKALKQYKEKNIIANPNCSTIQLVTAIKPIYDHFGIRRINVATYQAVSGAGKEAIEALAKETAALLSGQETISNVFPKSIAFNVLPQIDAFQSNGYTFEEMKMVWETQKILEDSTIAINPTAVRVPVFYGHSEAVNIETKKPATVSEIRALLSKAPGVFVVDDQDYPTAVTHAANHDGVFVGRIRQDISHPRGINLWIVSDNVRKGAALNAIQIAECIIQNSFYIH